MAESKPEETNLTDGAKKREEFVLSITAESIESTDKRFTMDDLNLGDKYKPLDAYFEKENGEKIRQDHNRGKRKISNGTMPLIACQIFRKQLDALSPEEKKDFPICKYKPNGKMIRGIFTNVDEYEKETHKTREKLIYEYDDNRQFIFRSWNIFSTIIFVQECLKRFGKPGDKFILKYREKSGKKTVAAKKEVASPQESGLQKIVYKNQFSSLLIESKNLIFRGAPGTGKTYLAKEIAADIVSDGQTNKYSKLTDEQKKQVEFVQFHPSYDYSDFIEGLRPKINDDGTMGFELQDGIFKSFVARARENYENSRKDDETIEKELSVRKSINEFFSKIDFGVEKFTTKRSEFTVTSVDDMHINIFIPGNAIVNKLTLKMNEIKKMLESGQEFNTIKDITAFFGKTFATQAYSYDLAIYRAIKKEKNTKSKTDPKPKKEKEKKYVFIIDEINRGEISKIFGELFFAIDPGYRGKAGEISTQYSNLHPDPDEKFYIPENVYIIGTMNDIDRSVDSFDFAMRRRFRFVELKANEHLEMLNSIEDRKLKKKAENKMNALNEKIAGIEDLNENYQIGASYFLKLKLPDFDFDRLWTDYLQPLLQEYIRGMNNEKEIMDQFAKAYGYPEPAQGDMNETPQNQG